MTMLFRPPTLPSVPWCNADTPAATCRLFRWYGPGDLGRSVVRIGGVYSTIDTPDQLTLAGATEIYQGGHEYVVSDATATALTTAGYGAYLSAAPSTGPTWGTYDGAFFWGELSGYAWGDI